MTRCLNCGRTLGPDADCICHDPAETQPSFEEFVNGVATGTFRLHAIERGQAPLHHWRIATRPQWWVTCHLVGGGVVEYLADNRAASEKMMGAVLSAQATAAA